MQVRAPRLACVVLAAGGSSRLGRPKQLLRRYGKPLLVASIEAALAVRCEPVTVVLGAEALRLRAMLARRRLGIRIVYNAAWREGLASSVRAALASRPHVDGATLFLVTDQPHVDRRALARLVRAWRRRPRGPVAASYGAGASVPAIVPNRLLGAARGLSGDTGLRALLREGAHPARTLEMPEAEFDVDTPEDLARL